MDSSLDAIADLLRRRIGLEPTSLGGRALRDAVRLRMTAEGVARISDYSTRLVSDAAEFEELVEELSVSESWFFRDVQPFACLRWFVKRRPGNRTLRVLSVPCGGGEEPYSLAMTLLDCGLTPEQFHVEAIDVSRRALRRAADGVFSLRAVREKDDWSVNLCRRFLIRERDGYHLAPELRGLVHWSRGNLAAADFLADRRATEDVIFCRNVLIYFTEEGRRTTLAHLTRLLDPEGLLYVGHTEARTALDPRFRVLSPDYPFALGPVKSAPVVSPPPVPEPPASPPVEVVVPGPVDPLPRVQALADAGRLDEAASLCEPLLATRPPPVAAFYLLGVIRQAQGRVAEARQLYERVLYLEPGHPEALVHLALLAESGGDRTRAERYRRRAERGRLSP